MLFRRVAARTARATVTVAVVATGAMTVVPALLAGPAQAATLTKPVVKLLTGVNQQVACLSKALCVVVGYDDSSVGDVVAVRNGVPGHVSVVRHTARLYSASCPNHSGCVALADPHSGVNAEFVAISKSGVVTSAKVVADASGDTISTISCRELTSCEVAGYNFFTNAIVAGTWNGRKLTLRSETAPKGSSDVGSSALACYGASCELVGDALRGTATTIGLSLTLNGTKLGKIRVSPGDVIEPEQQRPVRHRLRRQQVHCRRRGDPAADIAGRLLGHAGKRRRREGDGHDGLRAERRPRRSRPHRDVLRRRRVIARPYEGFFARDHWLMPIASSTKAFTPAS
jgi:hypothetical protein